MNDYLGVMRNISRRFLFSEDKPCEGLRLMRRVRMSNLRKVIYRVPHKRSSPVDNYLNQKLKIQPAICSKSLVTHVMRETSGRYLQRNLLISDPTHPQAPAGSLTLRFPSRAPPRRLFTRQKNSIHSDLFDRLRASPPGRLIVCD